MGQLSAKASILVPFIKMHTWDKSSQGLPTASASISFFFLSPSPFSLQKRRLSSVVWYACVRVSIRTHIFFVQTSQLNKKEEEHWPFTKLSHLRLTREHCFAYTVQQLVVRLISHWIDWLEWMFWHLLDMTWECFLWAWVRLCQLSGLILLSELTNQFKE